MYATPSEPLKSAFHNVEEPFYFRILVCDGGHVNPDAGILVTCVGICPDVSGSSMYPTA